MDDITRIIIAALIVCFVSFICNKLISKYWPKAGKLGINTGVVYCPNCEEEMPRVRKPANFRQTLWGGWTCNKCKTEMDKFGSKIN